MIYRRYFTIVEILLVLVIISGLAGLAILNLLRSRAIAQEIAAAGALRTIGVAQTQYRGSYATYANLSELDESNPPYIDKNLAAGEKHNYDFSSSPVSGNEQRQFIATALPQNINQAHTFYTDEDGVLCRSNTTNTPVPTTHVTTGCPPNFSEAQ